MYILIKMLIIVHLLVIEPYANIRYLMRLFQLLRSFNAENLYL